MAFRFSNLNIAHFLNRIFPPSSTGIANPENFLEDVRLVQKVLVPSLMAARLHIRRFSLIAPAVQIDSVPVPLDRFWYVHAVDLSMTAIVGAAGFSFIEIVDPVQVPEASVTVGVGVFETTDVHAKAFTHATTINSSVGFGGGTVGGGGAGSFIVPPGHILRGRTTATPAAGSFLQIQYLLAELLLGEEVLEVS